jgi:hypothetical protein
MGQDKQQTSRLENRMGFKDSDSKCSLECVGKNEAGICKESRTGGEVAGGGPGKKRMPHVTITQFGRVDPINDTQCNNPAEAFKQEAEQNFLTLVKPSLFTRNKTK